VRAAGHGGVGGRWPGVPAR